MGAVFAFAVGTNELSKAFPEAIARGMQITFALAAILIFSAIVFVIKMTKLEPFPQEGCQSVDC